MEPELYKRDFDTLIFDFDGTLAPSLELWMETFRYAFSFYGLELNDPRRFIKYFYQPLPVTAAQCGVTSIGEFAGHLEKGYLQAFSGIRLFPEVRELLECSKKAGFAIALVTSTPRQAIDYTLGRLGIADCFDVIVGGDEIKNPKPDPASIYLALQQLQKTPRQALVLGDYSTDILAGKAAGTHTALFLPDENRPFYDYQELCATRPDFSFSSFKALGKYLDLT